MSVIIGILGGMGPRATVQFEARLLDALEGSDQDLPTIMTINDGSIPDRSDFLLGQGADPVPHLQRNVDTLEAFGVNVICLPCNTACMPGIAGRLKFTRSVLIDLPQAVVANAASRGIQSVALLATKGTVASGRYQQLCQAAGMQCEVPSPQLRREVDAVIAAAKAGHWLQARQYTRRARRLLEALDCDAVILGCTELPALARELVPAKCLIVDSSLVLAEACVRYTKPTSPKTLIMETAS
ncbi:MAG TPA: amino acid racemase [Candidatus Saccharimonadales bacterium]|nr:amino acid racemase [Candidatus Saccharimonadales bacterium]